MLLADEPTGNLDTKSGEGILDLLGDLNAVGVTLIVVTHDPEVARRGDRIVDIRDGLVFADGARAGRSSGSEADVPDRRHGPLRSASQLGAHDPHDARHRDRGGRRCDARLLGQRYTEEHLGPDKRPRPEPDHRKPRHERRAGRGDNGPFGAAAASTLIPDDTRLIAGLPGVAAASSNVSTVASVGRESVSFSGVDPSYDEIRSTSLAAGRFVEGRGEVVLDASTADEVIAGGPRKAVGEGLTIGRGRYEVVGVAEAADVEFGPPIPESS